MGAARESGRGRSPAYHGIPFEPLSLHFLGVSAIFSSVSFFFSLLGLEEVLCFFGVAPMVTIATCLNPPSFHYRSLSENKTSAGLEVVYDMDFQ